MVSGHCGNAVLKQSCGQYEKPMRPAEDVAGLIEDLDTFRARVTFHLTRDPSLSDDVAIPLWQARNLVDRALNELIMRYGDPRSRG